MAIWLVCFGVSASAAVLDWSNVSWTAESLSGVFDVDGDSVNDVEITISDPTGGMRNNFPAIEDSLEGGLASPDEALRMNLNFDDDSDTIVITVTFLNDYAEATDVSFTLFDIDADRNGKSSNYQFRDRLESIHGSGASGLVGPTITPGAVNEVTGSGTNQVVSGSEAGNNKGKNSAEGNVTIDYGTQIVSSVTFAFGNSPNIVSGGNPDGQQFALHDITFNAKVKFPEVGSSIMSAAACGVAIFYARWRRRARK